MEPVVSSAELEACLKDFLVLQESFVAIAVVAGVFLVEMEPASLRLEPGATQ